MNKTDKILNYIDHHMQYDKWYNVKSEEQKQSLLQLMQANFLPDCEFNNDYTKFRKVEAVSETFLT